MAIGRIFPIPNPNRVFPIDPTLHGQTNRNAPLPFQMGPGSQTTIDTLYEVGFVIQRIIVQVNTTPGVPTVIGCTSLGNLYCVPQAVVTKQVAPTAVVRCAQ